MTTERIKEIQALTAYPQSVSVQQALLQVWNECAQEKQSILNEVNRSKLKKSETDFIMIKGEKFIHVKDIDNLEEYTLS